MSLTDPKTWQMLPFHHRKMLPAFSGVYAVIANGKILYIGESVNINERWKHHIYLRLVKSFKSAFIAFRETFTKSGRLFLESRLIAKYSPPQNAKAVNYKIVNSNQLQAVNVKQSDLKQFDDCAAHEARKIKGAVIALAGTLENAAREMSDEIYSFNGNQLSKVINGHSKSPIILDRLSRYIEQQEQAKAA